MEIGEEKDPIEVPLPVHPDQIPAGPEIPAEPVPVEVPA
jgi:hypothetical protein